MKARWLALALTAIVFTAQAQATDCPHASDADQATLIGLWHAEFENGQHAGTLLLKKDPEFAGTVIGTLDRDGERRQLAGDVGDEGDVTLEESADGVHIAATWLGEVVEGSCGKEIRGTWKADGATQGREFVLRKAP